MREPFVCVLLLPPGSNSLAFFVAHDNEFLLFDMI